MSDMRVHWKHRESTTLSDLYDADLRATEPSVLAIAEVYLVPHPLTGALYADAVTADRSQDGTA